MHDGEIHRVIAEKVARASLFQVRVSPCYRRQQTMQYEEVDYLHGFKGEITLARNVVKSLLVLNLISLVVSIVLPAKIYLSLVCSVDASRRMMHTLHSTFIAISLRWLVPLELFLAHVSV